MPTATHDASADATSRQRARRILFAAGLMAAAWTGFIAWSGGVAVTIAGVHVSSRAVRNPIIASVVLLAGAAWLAPRGARLRTIAGGLAAVWSIASRAANRLTRAIAILLDRAATPPWPAAGA